MKTLHLIDSSPIFHWYTQHMNPDRFSFRPIQSFVKQLCEYSDEDNDVVVCSDSRPIVKENYCKVDYYKANRAPMKDYIKLQRGAYDEAVKNICAKYGVVRQYIEGYEADDVMYATVKEYKYLYDKVILHTADSDMTFMVDEKVSQDRGRFGIIDFNNYREAANSQYSVDYNMVTFYNICKKNKDNRGTLGSAMLQPLINEALKLDPHDFCDVYKTLNFLSTRLNEEQYKVALLALPMILIDGAENYIQAPSKTNYMAIYNLYKETSKSIFTGEFADTLNVIENYIGNQMYI